MVFWAQRKNRSGGDGILSYLFRCLWDDSGDIFHIKVDAFNIRDARKRFSCIMDKREDKREFCLLGVYREV